MAKTASELFNEANSAFIDEEYLSRFDRREIDSHIEMQETYTEPVVMKDTYSVSDEGEEEGIFLSFNVAAGDNADNEEKINKIRLSFLRHFLFASCGHTPLYQL